MAAITLKPISEFRGHKQAVYTICPSPQEGHFFSGGSDGLVVDWNLATQDGTAVASFQAPVFSLLTDVSRKIITVGLQDGSIHFIDLISKQTLLSRNVLKAPIFDLAMLTDGSTVVGSDGSGNVLIFKNDPPELTTSVLVSTKSIRSMVALPDGKIAIGSSDNKVRILSAEMELIKDWEAHRMSVFRVTPSPDGRHLLTTGRDAHLKCWSMENEPTELHSIPAHMYSVNDIIFHPSGDYLFTCSMDKSIRMWSWPEMVLLKVADYVKHNTHRNGVNRLLWCGNNLLSCGDDGSIVGWEVEIK